MLHIFLGLSICFLCGYIGWLLGTEKIRFRKCEGLDGMTIEKMFPKIFSEINDKP